MTEHPQLETPGVRIRAAREERGLSLADLSELTKIPPPVLAAIEADEFHKVSGALYIKSFLRSCAAELGLDAGEVLDLYARFSGELRSSGGVANPVWEDEEVQISHVGLPWRSMALTGVALILVGAGVITLVRSCGDQASDSPGVVSQEIAKVETGGRASTGGLTQVQSKRPAAEHSARQDTLSGAWAQGAPRAATTVELANHRAGSDTRQGAGEVMAVTQLPLPLVGGPNLVFAGGEKQAVVMRLISERAVGLEVKRDAEQTYTKVVWPEGASTAPPLPPTGIESGKVYAVGRGLVLYWGAADHISVRLDRTDGVELTLNGKLRNLRNLRPGAELLLDLLGN